MHLYRRRKRKRRSNFRNFVVFTIYSNPQTKSPQQETTEDREEIEQRIKSLKAISHSTIQVELWRVRRMLSSFYFRFLFQLLVRNRGVFIHHSPYSRLFLL
ncbi:hypothetical protein AAHA92_22858 [Salvia divinorum]|uniref:Uncharacterized protein n=1 Tax=Salvia divinorum TaxID=28513 RepID=A0ABD1GQ46_SALDI